MTTTLLRAGALACALMTTTCLTAPAWRKASPRSTSMSTTTASTWSTAASTSRWSRARSAPARARLRWSGSSGAGGARQSVTIGFHRTQSGSNATIALDLRQPPRGLHRRGHRDQLRVRPGQWRDPDQAFGERVQLHRRRRHGHHLRRRRASPMRPTTSIAAPAASSLCGLVPLETVRPNGHATRLMTGTSARMACPTESSARNSGGSAGLATAPAIAWVQLRAGGGPDQRPARRRLAPAGGAVLSNAAVPARDAHGELRRQPSSTVTDITTDGGETWRLTGTGRRLTGIRRPRPARRRHRHRLRRPPGRSSPGDRRRSHRPITAARSTARPATMTRHRRAQPADRRRLRPRRSAGRPRSPTRSAGTTAFQYDVSGRLDPGDRARRQLRPATRYDARGNVTETRPSPSRAPALADIVTDARASRRAAPTR